MLINIFKKLKEDQPENPIQKLQKTINEIEEVSAAAFNDLNDRVTENTTKINNAQQDQNP